MSDLNLTQPEADTLIAMEKHRVSEENYDFPFPGGSLSVSLQSHDKREQFLIDVARGRIDLLKAKFQNRARQVVVLVRLDLTGSPHRNPDGEEIPCPHLHVYREGYGDKWAESAPPNLFGRTADLRGTLDDFMRFCNITRPPRIVQKEMF